MKQVFLRSGSAFIGLAGLVLLTACETLPNSASSAPPSPTAGIPRTPQEAGRQQAARAEQARQAERTRQDEARREGRLTRQPQASRGGFYSEGRPQDGRYAPPTTGYAGPGGEIKRVQALQQSVAWACFARFRPDADALLQRLNGQLGTQTIESNPKNFQRTVLSQGDPTANPWVWHSPLPLPGVSREAQNRITRNDVDSLVQNTSRYVTTLMSMPNAGAQEYRYANAMLDRAIKLIPEQQFPDDRLLCLQVAIGERFGGMSQQASEQAFEQVRAYGARNGGLTSTCFIALEQARRDLREGRPADALQRLEGLQSPQIGRQAGLPRMEDVYRDFGCQGASWLKGGLYWAGIGGQQNRGGALAAYQFCARSLDRCGLNAAIISAQDAKTWEQKHRVTQQLMALRGSRDPSVANSASQLLANVSEADKALAYFSPNSIRMFAGAMAIGFAVKQACHETYGQEACDRMSVAPPRPDEPKDDSMTMEEHFEFIEELKKNQ